MTDEDILRLRVRLAIAKDMEKDFRPNTSLRNIIQQYESRIKEAEK